VEKDLFRKVLQNYPSTTSEEVQELYSLKEAYPYSQLLHVLAARVSKDHSLKEQQNELQVAAVYSADRSVLKHMMSDQSSLPMPKNEAVTVAPSNIRFNHTVQTVSPVKIEKEKVSVPLAVPDNVPDDADGLAEKVIKDIQELYKTRHNFEMMFVDNPAPHLLASLETGGEALKSKRERIIELSKSLNAQPMKEGEEPRPAKRRRSERRDIIDEIVESKGEIEPANEKQKEQLEIIDHFIKTQPSISNSKEKPIQAQEGDLSTIKTGEFGDNVVSETLVELLLKQGKKDKAIEVLKKLIWKFPQKKTYFAAQIEELKK
jgi:hypothetical protein